MLMASNTAGISKNLHPSLPPVPPGGRLQYICVIDDGVDPTIDFPIEDLFQNREFIGSLHFHGASSSFHDQPNVKRYTRFHLRGTLKLMGCKNIDAGKIVDHVFGGFERAYHTSTNSKKGPTTDANNNTNGWKDPLSVTIRRSQFHMTVRHALGVYHYDKPHLPTDFPIACAVQDRKYSFTILLGGTSGCGKSTLAALLASRIGFAAVISTDNIRQLMRKFISRAEAPILWASTYHAGEILDGESALSHRDRIIKGYEAQNEMIFKQLDVLIGNYEARRESLIIEGVHLDTRLIMRLVKRHPTCIPFLMYISNEAKHRERFAIRSKYMTLDPHQNKYTKYFKNIRVINDYLCTGADEKMIPQIDNTNMDRSLATIHATIFNCLRRHIANHEPYYDAEHDNLVVVREEFEANKHTLWSSKGMLRVIREKASREEQAQPVKKKAKEADTNAVRGTDESESESDSDSDDDTDTQSQPPEPQPEDPNNFNSDDEAPQEMVAQVAAQVTAQVKDGAVPDPSAIAMLGSLGISIPMSISESDGASSIAHPQPQTQPQQVPGVSEQHKDHDDDYDSDDSNVEYFMDCGSLGS